MAVGISKLPEVKYRTEIPERLNFPYRNYQFIVVNKQHEDQYFEDLPPMNFSSGRASIPQHNVTNVRDMAFRETIASPHYRITYSYCDNGDHPEVIALSSTKTYRAKRFTAEEVSPSMYALQEAGLEMVYCNHHTIALRGGTRNSYLLSDGNVVFSEIHADDGAKNTGALYHNMTLLPKTELVTQYTYDDFVHVCFIPNDFANKFDLEHETMPKYVFDTYQMKAGEELYTKSFARSMYSFLHTCQGNFQVEEYEIPFQHNYEFDANQSIKIRCLEDGIITLLAQVPELDRSLFE